MFKVKSELISEQEETINSKLNDFSLNVLKNSKLVPNENLPTWGGFKFFDKNFMEKNLPVNANVKNFLKLMCEKQFPRKLMSFPILILTFGTVNNLFRLIRS